MNYQKLNVNLLQYSRGNPSTLEVIHNYKKFKTSKKTIVTIGTFDGVHIGHQKIIEQLVFEAKKEDAVSVVLTFFPHPRMVLQTDNTIKLIHTIDERITALEKTGLDYLIVHPFDEEFSRLTAIDFVRSVLVEYLNTSTLIIGYDHRFGKNREGNFEQLEEFGHMYDFEVKQIPAQDINDISVSSTKIRNALKDGDVKKANNYLGSPFSLTGTVVYGDQIGNTIGYPTANIAIEEKYKLIPKKGAYLVSTRIADVLYYGMMNIGNRPTVHGKKKTIEVHLFDYEGNLYGKKLQISLLDFLRKEQKFSSVTDLQKQLALDKKKSLELLLL